MKANNPHRVLLMSAIIAVEMPVVLIVWGVLGAVFVLIGFFAWLLDS